VILRIGCRDIKDAKAALATVSVYEAQQAELTAAKAQNQVRQIGAIVKIPDDTFLSAGHRGAAANHSYVH
jgi:hypothetical protein